MHYWIVINDNTVGPLTLDELKHTDGLTPETPLWFDGLAGWTTLGQVPGLMEQLAAPAPADSTEVAVAGNHPTPLTTSPAYTSPKTEASQAADPGEMPSSCLGWAIFTTVCCCLPAGVVGIIYASKVSTLWRQGRYDEARKAAETAMWWTVGGITAGLVLQPFVSTFQVLMQML